MTSPVRIDRYRPHDRASLDSLFRRVLGDEKTDALHQRWEWTYLHNPNLIEGVPLIFLARDETGIVGQYATMPVRLQVNGTEIDAAWGTDVMVAPERQRQGLGDRLFNTWDENTGASIGLGLTDASHGLFKKLKWPDMGRVPRFAKPLTSHMLDLWGEKHGTLGALGLAWSRAMMRVRPIGGSVTRVDHFDERVTRLWERVKGRFAFAVRRDAPYLEWKFVRVPHVRYFVAVLERGSEIDGYVVYRHTQEPDLKVTILTDFLTDPDNPGALSALLRWVDREAIAAGSDVIRTFSTCSAYHPVLGDAGYRPGAPAMRFVAKINAVPVPSSFYDSFDRWHVTVGDSDADR